VPEPTDYDRLLQATWSVDERSHAISPLSPPQAKRSPRPVRQRRSPSPAARAVSPVASRARPSVRRPEPAHTSLDSLISELEASERAAARIPTLSMAATVSVPAPAPPPQRAVPRLPMQQQPSVRPGPATSSVRSGSVRSVSRGAPSRNQSALSSRSRQSQDSKSGLDLHGIHAELMSLSSLLRVRGCISMRSTPAVL
jgi:hypothetical protein